MKKRFFIPACVLSITGIVFIIYAMGHPELSFPWSTQITSILYGLYADAAVMLFLLAFMKKISIMNILTIIFEMGAIFFLVQSILHVYPDGHANWYLPMALGLNSIAIFLNSFQTWKKSKENKAETRISEKQE
ncbi:MAG: hypothetical protein PUB22_06810 [Clostridiales bacterium]|nr:hypothetical protein [Clostridiales bacterium]